MNERQNRYNSGDRLKIFAGLVVLAFAVTLAVIVGNRLSDEAMAVLAGAVCGVGAAIPTSLLVVAVSRKQDGQRGQQYAQPHMQQGAYPPVVVVAPQGGQQWANDWRQPPPLTAPVQRQFTVVGGAQEAQRMNTEDRSYGHYS